ncbi:Hypp7085 [Branchiostoma lanceolatum]|uniref:Hypp7085 protein n=1 Tax=Branchiostoma lanceolatum TaxID=7740 RepID=A0A8J9YWZ7_BRALA|nr:Hypp7085 [Branchiostoma lanceolatum]
MTMAMTKILTGKYRTTGTAPLDLSVCSKGDVLEYFEASYDLNESLFVGLKDEDAFYKCPDRLRLPLIFYYAHTATVYVNKLMLAGMLTERVNLDFETMFETGVDEMSWDDTENYRMGGSFSWPPLAEAVKFRRLVRNRVRQLIEDTPLQLPITQDSPWWAVMMGVEHEIIHIETSSVLIRQMPITMVTTPPKWKYAPASTGTAIGENPLLRVEGGEVTFGKPKDFPSYGWCVEYGQRTFKVPTFEASKFKVTNREFLQFVKEGGYENSSYWTKEVFLLAPWLLQTSFYASARLFCGLAVWFQPHTRRLCQHRRQGEDGAGTADPCDSTAYR